MATSGVREKCGVKAMEVRAGAFWHACGGKLVDRVITDLIQMMPCHERARSGRARLRPHIVRAAEGRVKAIRHGFFVRIGRAKAMRHGFFVIFHRVYVRFGRVKAMLHGFSMTFGRVKAMAHGFSLILGPVKAIGHGFRAVGGQTHDRSNVAAYARITVHDRERRNFLSNAVNRPNPDDAPVTPTVTYHQRLPEEIIRDLRAVAAKIPNGLRALQVRSQAHERRLPAGRSAALPGGPTPLGISRSGRC